MMIDTSDSPSHVPANQKLSMSPDRSWTRLAACAEGNMGTR